MEATNTNPVMPGTTPLSADELRSKIVDTFKTSQPMLLLYRQYAESQRALNIEYHKARIAEAFPGVPVEETANVIVLDACETPKTLDTAISQLHGAKIQIKRVVHDLTKHQFLLYV